MAELDLQTLRFLIADPSSNRQTLRKLLSHFEAKPYVIDIAESYSEAKEILETKKPDVVFADASLLSPTGDSLLSVFLHCTAGMSPTAYFHIISKDSRIAVTTAADESIDGILVKPFTFESLKEAFLKIMMPKLKPTPLDIAIQRGKAAMQEGRLDEALKILKQVVVQNDASPNSHAMLGSCYQKLGDLESARSSFETGLKRDPIHYRCLMGIFEILLAKGTPKEAYAAGRAIVVHHTIPLQRLPDLVRLSIANGNYQDILGFFEHAEALAQLEKSISTHLAAGLVVCGLHFLKQKELEQAVSAFRKAEVMSLRDPKILKRILIAMLSHGLNQDARMLMTRLPDSVKQSPDIRLAEFEATECDMNSGQAITAGMAMVRDGVKSEKVFESLIKHSIALNRKREHLKALVEEASTEFPDQKERFLKLLSS